MARYKEMTDNELILEMKRVRDLLKGEKKDNYFTQKQNKAYLNKLVKEWRERCNKNG